MKTYQPKTQEHVPPDGISPLEALYTPLEAAVVAGVSQAAVRLAIRQGRLRAWARAGVYLIPAAELAAWQPVRGRGRRKLVIASLPDGRGSAADTLAD